MHDAPRPSRPSNRSAESARARDIVVGPPGGPTNRGAVAGLRVAEVLRAGAPSALALGVWTAVGGGCASTPNAAAAPSEVAASDLPGAERAAPRAPDRVVFSDETVSPARGSASAAGNAGGAGSGSADFGEPSGLVSGLVSALASSFEDDQAALAAMEAARRQPARVVFSDEADPVEPTAASSAGNRNLSGANDLDRRKIAEVLAAGTAPVETAATVTPQADSTPVAAPGRGSTAPTAGAEAVATAAARTTSEDAVPAVAPEPVVSQPVATTPLPTAANLPLEIVEPTPTEPAPLARLLAESLVRSSGESVEPLREWIAFSALALTDPSIGLPDGFGHDLLPAEKARVEAVHAAFAAVGRSLAEGSTELDAATIEALVAALGGGPKLAIPRVELCTKVERFGQFAPIASRRFLARSNARFIVYSELDGFSSALEGGRFVTRLASRVSIETDRDGVEVWRRSPEWTAVVDASEVRRNDFFVAEIVPLNEYLSVGSYRLKVELRDEATGATATSTVPFHIVADPAMAAVGD